ncbi:hypothetical protein ACFYO0_43780 [Streptomyces sp. NPDC006365]|uniref:hypothetical protein n=1 Tax=Streptomyces sp. NPDC006365 TaxID=3364744 RepID=UPI0036AAE369
MSRTASSTLAALRDAPKDPRDEHHCTTRARDILGWKPRHGSLTEWIASDLPL